MLIHLIKRNTLFVAMHTAQEITNLFIRINNH